MTSRAIGAPFCLLYEIRKLFAAKQNVKRYFNFSHVVCQIRFLGAAGGGSPSETSRNVLKRLMKSSVARQMNFKGTGGKKAFGSMDLFKIVCGEVSNKLILYFNLLKFGYKCIATRCHVNSVQVI
jgi:hypothetical protein